MVFICFRQHFPCASVSRTEFSVSVGSRAGFIYESDVILPSLKIIYIINVIIGLRRCYTSTFSVDIENSNYFSMFPSNFSLCVKSVRRSQTDVRSSSQGKASANYLLKPAEDANIISILPAYSVQLFLPHSCINIRGH